MSDNIVKTSPPIDTEDSDLTESERRRLLVEWNDTATPYAFHACVHDLFEARAARTPDAVALVYGLQEITYRELNERANQHAHYLQQLEVRAETRVGVCVRRSPEMIIGVLGILKAGGAYVPLDPDYPQERLRFMLEDTAAPILLTETCLLPRLPHSAARVVCLDAASAQIERQPIWNPTCATTPDQLVYVMYTSGSTGRPKGVEVLHRGVVRLVAWTEQIFSADDIAGVLTATSLSFDPSVLEMFMALCRGGTAILADNALQLLQLPAAGRVTLVNTVPSLMTELLRDGRLPGSVRVVALAGEALPSALVQQVYRERAVQRVYNLYGPTESVYTTFAEIGRWAEGPPPIGKPIGNTTVYVLDERLNPTGIGTPGELYIGGPGLARGYWNRPDLTQQRFLRNPFSATEGERLYRTGDRVRWLPDGNLEFLGRVDHQVKIRGHRIELGEIEATIGAHPAVEQVIVATCDLFPGQTILTAYATVKQGTQVTAEELQAHVRTSLPDYMTPSCILLLPAMPLTPNGKIDRAALPRPYREQLGTQTDYEPPSSPTEQVLIEIWSQVLHLPQCGINHNFFTCGGHSLLALQAIARIRAALNVQLDVRTLLDRPTVALLAAHIDALLQSAPIAVQSAPIPPASHPVVSPMQQSMTYASRHAGDRPVYNVPYVLRLAGELQIMALQSALQAIVDRHDALRSNFIATETTSTVVVHETLDLVVHVRDLSSLPPDEAEQAADSEIHAEARRPFDLARDILVRAALWRVDRSVHLLLLNIHHIVFDGWSMHVLMRELSALYAAGITGARADLPALPIRYYDYTAWEQQQTTGTDYCRQRDYWRHQLAGSPSSLNLPTDRPRGYTGGSRGGMIPLAVSAALTAQLRQLADANGVTLYMTLLAVWQTLLFRYSGQTDFVVSVSIARRARPETEGLIGCLLNVVLVRADMTGAPGFRELLRRVRDVTLDAYANQDVGYEQLEIVPRLQTMFVLQNTPRIALDLPGLTSTMQILHTDTAKTELTLDLEETPSGLEGWIEFDADLYNAATIARMAGHLQILLEGIVGNPDQRVSQLPLLTEAERQQLLTEWSSPQTALPPNVGVHTLFEMQAAHTPRAVAVVCEQEQITYQELDARANRLAHYLRSIGVTRDTRVGLCLERGIAMVVGMLGILKAGGAYVPFDPAYPADRLAFMLEDTCVPVVLTTISLANRLPASGARILSIDAEAPQIAAQSNDSPRLPVDTEDLIYIMYTSGSTGQPKGVCIPHRGVIRLVRQTDYIAFGPTDVCLQFAPLTFDASTFEIWGCLLNGGKLVLFPPHLPTIRELGEFIRREGITTLWLTAGLFHLMVAEQIENLHGVRQLLAGGDVLSAASVRRCVRELPDCTVINGYGPTENTTFTTCYRMSRVDQVAESVSIGRPIANTRAYVLDSARQLVPVGIVGELYAGGTGVANGYLNRPELTAERFVADPFHGSDRYPLYRTGDLVRWLSDGNLEFVGRIDQQIKIRGFRIEPGEIEAILSAHPAVAAVAVTVYEASPDDRRLVAYAVVPEPVPDQETILKQYARTKLPEHMVPARIVVVEALPMTANGKIDRKRLPSPVLEAHHAPSDRTAPNTDPERRLLTLWEAVLRTRSIGITDNFFALGGHSLLAIRLLQAVEHEFGISLSLGAMLKAPTVCEMATLLGRAEQLQTSWSPLVPLQPLGARPPLFCAPVGGGSAFYYRTLAAHIGADRPLYTLEPRGMSGEFAPHENVEEMAAYYIAAVRAVQPRGPYYLCGLSFGGTLAFEMAQQLQSAGEQIGLLLLFDTWAPGVSTPSTPSGLPEHLREIRQWLRLHREHLGVCRSRAEQQKYVQERISRLRQRAHLRLSGPGWQRDAANPAFRKLPELYRAVAAADQRAREAYRPGTYTGKVHLFKARIQPREDLAAHAMGWERYVNGEIEVIVTPGTHHTLLEEPCIHTTVVHLHDVLRSTQAS